MRILFLLLLFFPLFCMAQEKEKEWHPPLTPKKKGPPDLHTYHQEIFTNPDSTFGYRIFKNNKNFITQGTIPNRSNGFKTKADARKVGWEVMKRLRQNREPGISEEELKKMGL